MDRTDLYMLLRDVSPRTAVLRLAETGDRVEIVVLMLNDENDPSSGRALLHLPILCTKEGLKKIFDFNLILI